MGSKEFGDVIFAIIEELTVLSNAVAPEMSPNLVPA